MLSDHGYIKLRVGREHPLSDPNGYAYEHLIVWVSAGKSAPKGGETLHHVNEHQTDNRLGNLELLTRPNHNSLHISEMDRDPVTGRILGKRVGVDG